MQTQKDQLRRAKGIPDETIEVQTGEQDCKHGKFTESFYFLKV